MSKYKGLPQQYTWSSREDGTLFIKCDYINCDNEATRFDLIEIDDMPMDLETAYCNSCHALRFSSTNKL